MGQPLEAAVYPAWVGFGIAIVFSWYSFVYTKKKVLCRLFQSPGWKEYRNRNNCERKYTNSSLNQSIICFAHSNAGLLWPFKGCEKRKGLNKELSLLIQSVNSEEELNLHKVQQASSSSKLK